MEISLQDAPDILFDQETWQEFCRRFVDKTSALSAISRMPAGQYGYHGDDDLCLPSTAKKRIEYVEKTFQIGNQLVGSFKQSLIAGTLKATGVVYHLFYQKGEQEPVEIPPTQWERLWPIFKENGAIGSERYEHVRIHWDERKKRAHRTLEQLLELWLEEHKSGRLLKKQ